MLGSAFLFKVFPSIACVPRAWGLFPSAELLKINLDTISQTCVADVELILLSIRQCCCVDEVVWNKLCVDDHPCHRYLAYCHCCLNDVMCDLVNIGGWSVRDSNSSLSKATFLKLQTKLLIQYCYRLFDFDRVIVEDTVVNV